MAIEVPASQVYALAATLHGAAEDADHVAARLGTSAPVGGRLTAAADGLVECHRTAARALGGELRWLAGTVSGVADSWLDLDAALLSRPGQATPR